MELVEERDLLRLYADRKGQDGMAATVLRRTTAATG